MNTIALVGLAVYMSGHGYRGIPNGVLSGSIAMVIGGILVAMSLVV